ncbi:hypothetical protein V2P20_04360 [Methylobacter sp. Wu1]|uniref:hypothetical protein n=1 Tax=Methylobacter sp. Wu1 TaxID=3119359 RepID=UPI002F954A29
MKIKKLGVFLTILFVTTPGHSADTTYDPAAGTVTIPEVEIDGKVAFVNVKLERNSNGTFSVISTEEPPVSRTDTTYDPASGTVTIPTLAPSRDVSVINYANFKLQANSNGTFSLLSFEKPQVSDILYCSTYAAGTDYCIDGSFPTCPPVQSQVDKIKAGMSYDEVVEILGCHGVLVVRTDQYGTEVAFYAWSASSDTFPERNVNPRTFATVGFYKGSVKFINQLLAIHRKPSDLVNDSDQN